MRPISTRARHLIIAPFLLALACAQGKDVTEPGGELPSWDGVAPHDVVLHAIDATVQLRLVDSKGAPVTIPDVTWRSLDPSVALVSGSGLVQAVGVGDARIVSESDTHADTAIVHVQQVVAAVALTPPAVSLSIGGMQPVTVAVSDSTGHPIAGRTATWSSSATGVATVSSTGVVTAVAAGSATITAEVEKETGTMTVTVSAAPPAPVATVSVSPATATVVEGRTQQLTATLKDASGTVLGGRTVTWSSNAIGVATVSSGGLVQAVAPGTATITATSEGRSGTATITVTRPAVASVVVSPGSVSLQAGSTQQFTVTLRDASGTPLTGRTVTWATNNSAVVTVAASGLATAQGAGSTTITATSEGISGTASVTVTTTPPPPPLGTYYVSPAGNDANPGSASAPFRTIQKAANVVQPGDVVIVEDGTWTDTDGDGSIVNINRGGTAAAPITFRSRNKWGAKLDGQNGQAAQGIDFNNGIGWVRVEGFEIFGVANVGNPRGSASGVDAYDGGHDSWIVGNHIHHVGRVCTNSGNTNGEVGIFVQQPNLTIEENLIHDIGRFFPGENGCSYTGGFTGYMTLDHGIYLNGGSPGADGALIRNNIFYNTRHGWAIQWYPGSLDNIRVLNNTFAYSNPNKSYTAIVLDANISNSSIINNVFYNPEGGKTIEAGGFAGAITIANNITTGSAMTDRSSIPAGMMMSNNQLNTDPRLVNPAGGDFNLQAGSPAIDAGQALTLVPLDFERRARPRGAGFDIGALER